MPFLMLLSIPIAYYVKGFSLEMSVKVGPLFNLGAFVLLGCVPTLIVHSSHYWRNKNLKLYIDDDNGLLTIDQEQKLQYDFASLECTEYLALSKKRNEDGKFRVITPWSNYSYIKIKTRDQKVYKISSTVINSEDFPVELTEKKYTFWPVLF